MSHPPMSKVYVGASDWLRPEWVGSFYPEDMPEEWRLTYYNTQFSCVWLPYPRWSAASMQDLHGWREDTHGAFRFVLERPLDLDPAARARLDALAERLGTCCAADDASLVWFDAQVDLKRLAARLQGRMDAGPLYLLSRDGDLATLEQVQTLLGLLGL